MRLLRKNCVKVFLYRCVWLIAMSRPMQRSMVFRKRKQEGFCVIRCWRKRPENGNQELPAGSRVKIALAHHRDDNAETILHHLLRGSGLTGLAGIRPVPGRRIRPLLCVGREEIRAYLEAGHISWCEDSTNQSPDYTRNRIRSQVLPLLKTAVNEQAEEHILQAGQIIGQADAYLRQQAEEIWQEAVCGREEDLAAIPLTAFARQPEILKTYLIRHMLDQLHPGWKDIGSRPFHGNRGTGRQTGGKSSGSPGRTYGADRI